MFGRSKSNKNNRSDDLAAMQRRIELEQQQQQILQQQVIVDTDDAMNMSLSTLDTRETGGSVGKGTLLMDALRQSQKEEQQQQRQQQQQLPQEEPPSRPNSLLLSAATVSMKAKHGSHAVVLGSFAQQSSGLSDEDQPQKKNNSESKQQNPQYQGRGVANYGATASASPSQGGGGMQQFFSWHKQQQQHDFEYNHPDALSYQDPYGVQVGDGDDNAPSSCCFMPACCFRLCCCLQPLVSLMQSEMACKSFCYGSIDGMLTGAGIVAAFWGTGLCHLTHSPPEIKVVTVLFSTAACVADALCLALGHVWTTRVSASAHASERRTAQYDFYQQTAATKGLLVDRLLATGMLKIDAMSLADTLEGYPDLFVSALMGDALTAGVGGGGGGGGGQPPFSMVGEGGNKAEGGGEREATGGGAAPAGKGEMAGGGDDRHLRTIPSYGRFGRQAVGGGGDSMEDSESRNVRHAVSEASKESFCMMVGFSLFATVPSLIYWMLPHKPLPNDDEGDVVGQNFASSLSDRYEVDDDENNNNGAALLSVQPGTLFVFLTCVVMGSLGVWKSSFEAPAQPSSVNNPAVIFALEAMAVLLVCLAASYGLGFLLSQWVLSSTNKQFVLQLMEDTTL